MELEKERYSNDVKIDFDKIYRGEAEQSKDYLDSIFKTFTELEKAILEILTKSKSAITKNQIRSFLTYSFIKTIAKKFISNREYSKKVKNLTTSQEIALDYAEGCILGANKQKLIIEYPQEIQLSSHNVDKILFEMAHVPDIKTAKTINLVKLHKINKKLESMADSIQKESQSQFLIRARKILTSNGLSAPSMNSIEPTLKYFKEREWANYRIQNLNEVWFLTPKMNMMMLRVNRFLEKDKK